MRLRRRTTQARKPGWKPRNPIAWNASNRYRPHTLHGQVRKRYGKGLKGAGRATNVNRLVGRGRYAEPGGPR